MRRSKHPNKEIEAALCCAEALGWEVLPASGHAFAIMRCPWNDATFRCGAFCQMSIWSTPKDPENHARSLRRGTAKFRGNDV